MYASKKEFIFLIAADLGGAARRTIKAPLKNFSNLRPAVCSVSEVVCMEERESGARRKERSRRKREGAT